MALTANQLRFIQVNGAGTSFTEQVFVPTSGQFIKIDGSLHPTSSDIVISDVTGLTSALSGKQDQSDRLDNFVAATAPGIVRIDAANGITILSSTSYGEGILNTADAAAARTYLGISGLVGAVVYQGTLSSQGAIDALPAASSRCGRSPALPSPAPTRRAIRCAPPSP